MNTKTSLWMRLATGLTATIVIFTTFVGQASARILFQDDTVGDFDSETLNLGANDAGANNTSIQFGSDVTPSENGVINWNVTTNTLEMIGGFSIPQGATNPATCTEGNSFYNTTDNTVYVCTATNTWTAQSAGSQDFESVYGADGDKSLSITDNLATGFEIKEGANSYVKLVTTNGSEAVQINEDAVIGDNGDTVVINSSDWDINATGDMTGIGAITMDGLLTGTAGATVSGGAVSLNNNSNNAVNIGTGTSTGAVSIGGGSNTVAVDSTSWDISTAGVLSGLTGLTSTGVVNFSGASRLAMQSGAANPGTCTEGDLFYNTTDNLTYSCTATNTWTAIGSGGDATTLDGLDSLQFLRSDTSDNFTSGTLTFDNGTTLTVNGVANIGDGGDAVAVNSSSWDISAAGVASGFTGITSAGGAVSLNNNSNFAIDLATGTSTGAVSIGGGSGTLAINTTSWDVSSAGAATGFTTVDASGNFTTSAGTFCVGTTCLNEITSATDSGAFLVGAFDEFDNSNSTTVQGVLNDLDAKIGANAANVDELTFYPEYPDVVIFKDLTANSGTLVSDYDSVNRRQYYGWTSSKASLQDLDLRFRYELPADWVATGDLTLQLRTLTTGTADNAVDLTLRNETDNTTCAASTGNVSGVANTWGTMTVTAATINAGCSGANTLAPGDIIEIIVKNFAKNTGRADVGKVQLDYTN